jgi:choline-glycine betaine transporter
MPRKFLRLLWAVAIILTAGGLVLALVMASRGHTDVMLLLPSALGVTLLLCLLLAGLIHDVVSDILNNLQRTKDNATASGSTRKGKKDSADRSISPAPDP